MKKFNIFAIIGSVIFVAVVVIDSFVQKIAYPLFMLIIAVAVALIVLGNILEKKKENKNK